MKVNGKTIEFEKNKNIISLLEYFNLNEEQVVVEVNFEIIEVEKYKNYILREEDIIEIIRFVGGG
ncbi:sulfur carrier protein ThiS [Romboutsia lituseburensis]|uniref:Sulfur carrier protein n=1 Tax=Romboutsia lituseburensis DSM 797 TaxID=1121325 RepID=A0A1G9KYV7_9FIRM|nr:sulfur carrier protein ThiS [Romboutsia lituseburensis]CEH35086.1 Molybdopterin synthase/thiamin biosynthesis sulphur carrier, beta-grasp [Romboutsia lituseburensis]SDL55050.1 sulfur carrier protein [Romboutsia lituseburensis DSM 797]